MSSDVKYLVDLLGKCQEALAEVDVKIELPKDEQEKVMADMVAAGYAFVRVNADGSREYRRPTRT